MAENMRAAARTAAWAVEASSTARKAAAAAEQAERHALVGLLKLLGAKPPDPHLSWYALSTDELRGAASMFQSYREAAWIIAGSSQP